MKKVLIIDDHAIVRAGLKALLSSSFSSLEIHEAPDEASARSYVVQTSFELIILDILLPGTDSFRLLEYLRIHATQSKVLVFSMTQEKLYGRRYIKAGAMGYLSKEASLEELTRAVQAVLNNRRYVSEPMLDLLLDQELHRRSSNPFDDLSRREFEIATLLLSGHNNFEIASILSIQTTTIGTYKARIFKKLKVKNILELKDLSAIYQTP